MLSFSQRLTELNFGWNERPVTDVVLNDLCKRINTIVEYLPLSCRGYSYRTDGRDHIKLNRNLRDNQELLIWTHEIGHVVLHAPLGPEKKRYSGDCGSSREELEADATAYCGLIPLPMLLAFDAEELITIHGYSSRILMRRLEIYERYKF
jgi:Zn-dependent peptidase ImmA (M78 family)